MKELNRNYIKLKVMMKMMKSQRMKITTKEVTSSMKTNNFISVKDLRKMM